MAAGTGTGDILPPTIGGGPRHGEHHAWLDSVRRHKGRTAAVLALTGAAVAGGLVAAASGNSSAAASSGQHLVLKANPCDAITDAARQGLTVTQCPTDLYDANVTRLHAIANTTFGTGTRLEINVVDSKTVAGITAAQLDTMSDPLPEDAPYGAFSQQAQLANWKSVTPTSIMVNGASFAAFYETGSRQPAMPGTEQMVVDAGNNLVVVDVLSSSEDAQKACNVAAAAVISTVFESGAAGQ